MYISAESGLDRSAHRLRASGPLFTGRQVLQTPSDRQETLRSAADATTATRALNARHRQWTLRTSPSMDFTLVTGNGLYAIHYFNRIMRCLLSHY